jgi:hypothetical protein
MKYKHKTRKQKRSTVPSDSAPSYPTRRSCLRKGGKRNNNVNIINMYSQQQKTTPNKYNITGIIPVKDRINTDIANNPQDNMQTPKETQQKNGFVNNPILNIQNEPNVPLKAPPNLIQPLTLQQKIALLNPAEADLFTPIDTIDDVEHEKGDDINIPEDAPTLKRIEPTISQYEYQYLKHVLRNIAEGDLHRRFTDATRTTTEYIFVMSQIVDVLQSEIHKLMNTYSSGEYTFGPSDRNHIVGELHKYLAYFDKYAYKGLDRINIDYHEALFH